MITTIMTGFFEELSEVIMQVIIRPASIDPPPAHRLRSRPAHSHTPCAERPPSEVGLALLTAALLFLPLFRIRKQKRLKENAGPGFPRNYFSSSFADFSSEPSAVKSRRFAAETPSLRSGPSGDCALAISVIAARSFKTC
jgi:hypothetical protein